MRFPNLNRSVVMMLIAAIAGLCAAWAARQHIQGRIEQIEANARVPTVQRVVAAFDMPAGMPVTADKLAVRDFPAELVSSDSLPPERFSELAGHRLQSPLRAGDPILPVHIAMSGNTAFSTLLSEGRRAMTIPVDAINSVSGLLQPGDLIDLYVSFEYQRRKITAPLLQGVLVLATGTNTRSEDIETSGRVGGYSTVTLDTSPEDAIKLVAARQSGIITALLRNPTDGQSSQRAVRGDLASLLGVGSRPPSPATSCRATVIYGNQSIKKLPSLKPSSGEPRNPSGLFDLPFSQELVSAWMRSQVEQRELNGLIDPFQETGALSSSDWNGDTTDFGDGERD